MNPLPEGDVPEASLFESAESMIWTLMVPLWASCIPKTDQLKSSHLQNIDAYCFR